MGNAPRRGHSHCCGSEGSSGGWDFCGDPTDCPSREHYLGVAGIRDRVELAVGQTLRVSARPALCPCDDQVADVEWRASAPDIVRFAPDGPVSAVVTALAPGQAAITAEIRFKSVTRSAKTLPLSDSPLLITVVAAAEE
jgi:hypothetical protein